MKKFRSKFFWKALVGTALGLVMAFGSIWLGSYILLTLKEFEWWAFPTTISFLAAFMAGMFMLIHQVPNLIDEL